MHRSFLSCDWGTTHFRLRLVDADTGDIVSEIKTADGVAAVADHVSASGEPATEAFPRILAEHAHRLLAGEWHGLPACVPGPRCAHTTGWKRVPLSQSGRIATHCVVSGMASSRLGWIELPYAEVPAPLSGSSLNHRSVRLPLKSGVAIEVILVSGLKTETDVMRGEETEAVGLATLHPEWFDDRDILLILPGTHSKHLTISGDNIVSFQTFMTGELFAHLAQMPTLKHCVDSARITPSSAHFRQGVRQALNEELLPSLFKVRALNLLGHADRQQSHAYLSGLLIGSELRSAMEERAPELAIAATGDLAGLYQAAIDETGILNVRILTPENVEKSVVHGHLRILKDI